MLMIWKGVNSREFSARWQVWFLWRKTDNTCSQRDPCLKYVFKSIFLLLTHSTIPTRRRAHQLWRSGLYQNLAINQHLLFYFQFLSRLKYRPKTSIEMCKNLNLQSRLDTSIIRSVYAIRVSFHDSCNFLRDNNKNRRNEIL